MKKRFYAIAAALVAATMLQGCGKKTEGNVQPTSQPTAQPTAQPASQPSEMPEPIVTVEPSEAPETTTAPQPSEGPETSVPESGITSEMAYEGVSNYCHSNFDWNVAEGNPEMMYVEMGDESETEYKVIFRSYTGSFIYFYVDKATGTTRMVESVPDLEVENDVGTIELLDYLKKD